MPEIDDLQERIGRLEEIAQETFRKNESLERRLRRVKIYAIGLPFVVLVFTKCVLWSGWASPRFDTVKAKLISGQQVNAHSRFYGGTPSGGRWAEWHPGLFRIRSNSSTFFIGHSEKGAGLITISANRGDAPRAAVGMYLEPDGPNGLERGLFISDGFQKKKSPL